MADESRLRGTVRALLLFDIAEEINLADLHSILGTTPKREPAFAHPVPEYVRYARPPVSDHVPQCQTSTGDAWACRVRYFDYGVAGVEMQLAFDTDWPGLVRFANRWVGSQELESKGQAILKNHIQKIGAALKKPYDNWISEEYYVIQLDHIQSDGQVVTAEELLQAQGPQIAQIVRGEESPLSAIERREVLQASMSYYPTDLLVVGWTAAMIYDTSAGALAAIDLLEYANTQLLEFRHYDDVLTRVLTEVYKLLERRRGVWSRWSLAREAQSLNSIRLEIRELSERTDNAIKFLSDMFYARAYRLASTRIGVRDYHELVKEKLTTAEDLYDSMINEFHQGRAFVLELLVVVILVIELVFLFRGK